MNSRKGQFTIPNLVGVVLMLFIFAVTFEAQKSILLNAASKSDPLLTAVLYTIPVLELLVIFGSPFMLAQKKYERDRRRGRR